MTKSQELALIIKHKSEAISRLIFTDVNGERVIKSMLTDDERLQLKNLESEVASLEGEVSAAKSLEDLATKNNERLNTINQAQGRVPMAETKSIEEKAAATEQKGVAYEGSEYAGSAWVTKQKQLDRLQVVYEEGFLGMDQKQMQTIASPDYKSAFRSYMRKGKNGLTALELKVMQEGIDSQGGFLVPDDILNTILSKSPTPTRLAGLVTNLQTSRDHLLIPRTIYNTDDLYSTGIRTSWTGEIPSSSTVHRVTEPVFGQLRIPVHTNMMSLPVTNDMVEDSAFPLISWITDKFRETVDLLKDNMIINGTGSGQPAGILMAPGATDQPAIVNSGHASQVTADGLVDLGYALPEQYDENARFVLNKTATGKQIAKLKDTTNRYLFGMGTHDSGLAAGRPNELQGYPYIFSGFMPDPAANAYPVIFGDLRGYVLLNRIGFSVQVLNELYAETNQVVILGRVRFGGQVAEPYKIKILKCAV